jgi:hypothetical protein
MPGDPLASLTAKAGPLPVWAWLAGGAGVLWYVRSRSSASTSTAASSTTQAAPVMAPVTVASVRTIPRTVQTSGGGTPAAATMPARATSTATGTAAVAAAPPSAVPASVADMTPTQWATAFLAAFGAPATQANLTGVISWIRKESQWPPGARNNPLNTTQPAIGATTFNSVGVKNYPSAATGLTATAQTITNGYYPDLVAAFRSGAGVCGKTFKGFATWSGGGYSSVC